MPFDPLLGLTEAVPGDPAVRNAWGQILNLDMTMIGQAITGDNSYGGGTGGINIGGLTTYTLTATQGQPNQARQLLYPFTGALTGACTVTIATTVKFGWALNATTGAQNVLLTSGAGTQATLPPDGAMRFFYCDGNGNVTLPPVSFGAINDLVVSGGLTVTTGGITITTGGLTVSAGSVTAAGVVTGSSGLVSGTSLAVAADADIAGALSVTGNADVGGSLTVSTPGIIGSEVVNISQFGTDLSNPGRLTFPIAGLTTGLIFQVGQAVTTTLGVTATFSSPFPNAATYVFLSANDAGPVAVTWQNVSNSSVFLQSWSLNGSQAQIGGVAVMYLVIGY